MFKLPLELEMLIFQFDSTYHEKYKEVLQEFKSRVLWKIVWINSDRKSEYIKCRYWRDSILNYWNVSYAICYNLIPSENSYYCVEGIIKLKDVKWINYHPIL